MTKIATSKEADNLFDKAKKVKANTVIRVLQKSDYEGYPVYLRMIDGKIFEYLIFFEGELYTGFNVITPEKGKKKLNEDQIAQCGALIFTGAITTIDQLIANKKSREQKN